MWYITPEGAWADSKHKVLFSENFNRTLYEVREDGMHTYGMVTDESIRAIQARVFGMYSNGRYARMFDKGLSYAELKNILDNKPVHKHGAD